MQLDLWMNSSQFDKMKKITPELAILETQVKILDVDSLFYDFFPVLWYAKLPCFDVKEVTAGV